MRSSNTSPEVSSPSYSGSWLLAPGSFFPSGRLAIGLFLISVNSYAIDPNRSLSQYIHDHWGLEKGFPAGPVYALAQTTDGYLWIGTEAGLVRFDGLTFQLTRSARPNQLSLEQPLGQSLGITADDSGSLWIRLRGPNLLGYREGVFFEPPPDLEQQRSGVTVATRTTNDEVLFATRRNGLLALRAGKLVKIAPPESMPGSPVVALARISEDIWLGTRDAGLVRLRAGQTTPVTKGLPDMKINCLLPVDSGLWIGTDNGIVRWNGTEIVKDGVQAPLQHSKALAMIQDMDHNIWIGTAEGLYRVNTRGFSKLGSEPVTTVFEDRDGNIWSASANGIDRLRDSVFATWSAAQGLPSDANGPIYPTRDRTVFAPIDGGLYSLNLGKIDRVSEAGLNNDVVYAIGGSQNDIWIGRQRGGLTHLQADGSSFAAKTYTTADGLAQNSVLSVWQTRDGAVWAGTLNAGVSRLRHGRFTTFTTANGMASNTVYSMLEDSAGAMWFATSNGLSSFANNSWRTYGVQQGLPSENVNCLFEDSSGTLLVGTLGGLALLRSGHIEIPALPASLHEQIFGIAEDRSKGDKNGSLWITTANHVVRVNGDRLELSALGPGDLREFELADGLQSLGGVKRHRSVIADPAGRIWLSLTRGISVVDPTRLTGRSLPALVHIQAISADGNSIALRDPVRIPPSPHRITLDYAGLSLSIPERTRFRYTLEGFDHGWSSPVADRQAAYTNLGPGTYTFRVVASNLDQVFNSAEAAVSFQIEPTYWQTWWFRTSAFLMFALAIAGYIAVRMRRLTDQMNVRFEERLAERTRIAQELHDTLLQGFLSASMQLHVAADNLPGDSSAKPALGRILDLMRRVIGEGRNALQDLRMSPGASLDLQQAFSRIPQELAAGDGISFRVIIEGRPRPLHPVIRDEVYRIGREALANAFRHAKARSIEVELEYSSREFRVLIRDNGCGIDPAVLASGREGHWGLSGMRERAERIGARLRLWSRPASGTEVELSIPGKIAFKEWVAVWPATEFFSSLFKTKRSKNL